MGVRFGLDIGVASVGWAVVNDNYEVEEAGSNIFTSADANQNVERRSFRQIRRLHRRRCNRINDFKKLWINTGLPLPAKNTPGILELRTRGLNGRLSEEELFHVLRNELLHRGISYLDDAADSSGTVQGNYAKGINENQKELDSGKFPCEIQSERLRKYGKYHGNISVGNGEEKIILSNVFTTGAYKKEILAILEQQKKFLGFLTDSFCEKYIEIFLRKREYYTGPGNEKSRTDYGRFTTRTDEKGEYITEDNIFEKLIGKCSVYKHLMRAAGATYTAQEFNLLNDLNNITVNGRKLSKEEKEIIINEVKTANSFNMRKILKKAISEDIETLTGARLDKNEKEDFHKFAQYNAIRKEFEKNGWNITSLSREELDSIGNVLTLNTEKEAILNGFKREKLSLPEEMQDCLISLRKQKSTLFNKWQSFSLNIMLELIPGLYEQPKNQMELLTETGIFKSNKDIFKNCTNIPADAILENIYNPVVSRSIRITIQIVNALIKKYGYPDQIIIEMPRDKNEEEMKKKNTEMQKKNQKELDGILKKISSEYGIKITEQDFHQHKKLVLKLKLWNEQGGKCLYSGRTINIQDLLYNPSLFEIDHIIPKSISFDDSRSNKVLVYGTENQKKSNTTPYNYLRHLNGSWGYKEYFDYVCRLRKDNMINKRKMENLLFTEDITKIEVLKGFIARNINDTRYASRVVLNTLQGYFQAKEAPTKIKVVRGSFTHQFRNNLYLEKNRDESYSHHAVDAMIMCYSQMGFDEYHKLRSEIIDFETGEILDTKRWEEEINEKTYNELIYQNKMIQIRANIKKAEKNVKFWHKRDSKPNRGLCNQTIRGTRNDNGIIKKVNKLNIYNPSDVETLKKMISNGKEDCFLMYRHDKRTWENMLQIMEDYRETKNPFTEYENETGDYLRKYSKKHNGPRITKLKYLNGEVGSCLDISHKYGFEKGSRKVILENLNPYRMDVYYNEKEQKYYLIGIKYADLRFDKDAYIINETAYNKILVSEKLIQPGQTRNDLEKLGYKFMLSFYKNEIIQYEKDGEYYTERFLSRTKPKQRNCIETKPLDAPKFNKPQKRTSLSKTTSIKKVRFDILGNKYYSGQEKFKIYVDIN
ncbi:MAG: type II CRISPR RNA-guided endonuclease Cas9 [Lachnospiraceae bacterium]|nr:type II CRISPR RNA-guided endonuclease Cas9 [Lachnospiraceae bacterium]